MEEKSKLIKECDICGEMATSLCFKCVNYFCENCYKLIHEKKKNSSHIKEIIDPFVPFDLKCPDHPSIPINLFCADEKGKSIITYINFLYIRTLLPLLLL